MSHTGSPDPTGAAYDAEPVSAGFSAADWRLLTRLPGQVIVAARTAGPDDPVRAVTEGLAGLDGIAAGRAFDSELVRAVVATIYAESEAQRPAPGPPEHTQLDELRDACRAAVRVLDRHADPADSAAYRQWVESVAARVCRAGQTASSPADTRFLDRLGGALDLR